MTCRPIDGSLRPFAERRQRAGAMAFVVFGLICLLFPRPAAADNHDFLRDPERARNAVDRAACIDESALTLAGLRLGAPMATATAAYGRTEHAGACLLISGAPCTEVMWLDLGLTVVADSSSAIRRVTLAAQLDYDSRFTLPAGLQFGMDRSEIHEALGRRPGAPNSVPHGYRFPQCQQSASEGFLDLWIDLDDRLSDVSIAAEGY